MKRYTFLPESGTFDDNCFSEYKHNLINIEKNYTYWKA